MKDLAFSIDPTAFAALLVMSGFFFVIWRWSWNYEKPHLKYSNVSVLKRKKKNLKETYANLPERLILISLCLFGLAFLDPHYYAPKVAAEEEGVPIEQVFVPTEGVAIYLVLDRSGSMAEEVKAYSPRGRRVTLTKMDLLKQVTQEFVEGRPGTNLQGRPNDLLGLVAFARGAQVLAPLTLDHQAILEKLDQLNYATDIEQDGTAIGYAIYKTANLIAATRHYAEDLVDEERPAYEIKSNVMILVTDGIQAPNPLDQGKRLRNIELVEAADYARKNDIRLYIVNVEPRMASEEFALHRKLMKQIAELTGGEFFLVDSSMDLGKIYAEIDSLEKSRLPVETKFVTPPKSQLPHLYRRVSFYPYFVALGMVSLFFSFMLGTVAMRRVP